MLKKVLIKFSLFSISLLIALLFLEISMGIAGNVWLYKKFSDLPPYDENSSYIRDESYESYLPKKAIKRSFLAIGDSFTNAGNVQSFHSYPYHLFKLANSDLPTSVTNMGLCEDSTFGVLDRLNALFRANSNIKYDYIFFLIGAADKFERFEIERDDRYEGKNVSMIESNFFHSFHIYKMFRHIRFALLQMKLTDSNISNNSLEVISKTYQQLILKIKASKSIDIQKFNSQLPQEFFNYVDSLSVDYSTPEKLAHSLLIYKSKIHAANLNHDIVVNDILEFANIFPLKFWNHEFDDAYFRLVQSYQIQSKIDPAIIIRNLNQVKAKVPALADMKYFFEFYELVSDSIRLSEFINRKRSETWNKLFQLSQDKGFKIVIINYPSPYIEVNKHLKEVSNTLGLPYVDANAYFNDLLNTHQRSELFEDDDHLTKFGYKKLSELIYSKVFPSP